MQPVLSAEGPIPIAFRGVCASEDSIFFKVADGLSRLNELRAKLRHAISAKGLPSTMDKRYRLEAGHVTGIRFINRSGDIPGLVEFIRTNSDKEMGSMEAGNIELVNNDWFMSESKTVVLRNFWLGAP